MRSGAGGAGVPFGGDARGQLGSAPAAGPLEGEVANLGARLMVQTLDNFARGAITPVAQPAAGATYAPRLTSEDGKLNPATMTAQEIDRRVRALGERLACWVTPNAARGKDPPGPAAGAPAARS